MEAIVPLSKASGEKPEGMRPLKRLERCALGADKLGGNAEVLRPRGGIESFFFIAINC